MTTHAAASALIMLCGTAVAATSGPALEFLGRYETGIFDDSAAEIVAFDAPTQRVFVTNAADNSVDVLCIGDPASPTREFSIDLAPFGGGVNSVAVSDGRVAVAVEAEDTQANGSVVFFDTDGSFVESVTVGALPDMLTFTPDGRYVLVANEGEPNDDYTVDPEGSVSVIRVTPGGVAGVRTVTFEAFNDDVPPRVRVFGPGATLSQDLEPEYIAVSPDSGTAYVVCQENNAIAIIDVKDAELLDLVGLGTKNHRRRGNELDASNDDGDINIRRWPVRGLYQPDAMSAFEIDGETYIVTANEGDARDYDAFSEEARVRDLALDPDVFPNAAALQLDENLGRLKITTTLGDRDGDGDYDRLFSYGARSISVWDGHARLVWDSGDIIEQVTAAIIPDSFNSTNDENGSFDNRSDDKGPEPEAITVAELDGRVYAFVGLERVGGIMTFDITDPHRGEFVDYINSRDFAGDAEAGTAGDLGPEGLVVIPAADSPIGAPLLVASHEVSGTTAVYLINTGDEVCDTPYDLNRDCEINIADLLELVFAFGPCDACACPADFNGDGNVNILDLLNFLLNAG